MTTQYTLPVTQLSHDPIYVPLIYIRGNPAAVGTTRTISLFLVAPPVHATVGTRLAAVALYSLHRTTISLANTEIASLT